MLINMSYCHVLSNLLLVVKILLCPTGERYNNWVEVGRCEGQTLEVADEAAESEMDIVWAHTRTCVGRRRREKRENHQGCADGGSGRKSAGRVP